MSSKKVYMIWCKTDYDETPCFIGRDIYWTTSKKLARAYKKTLEENAENNAVFAKFQIVSFEVVDNC